MHLIDSFIIRLNNITINSECTCLPKKDKKSIKGINFTVFKNTVLFVHLAQNYIFIHLT